MNLVIDCQLFPCIDYMKTLLKATNIKIELFDSFQKMSFRNRYVIVGANGPYSLTVPLLGGREQKTLMKDIRIERITNWPIKHWRSIVSAYARSPYFEFYADDVKSLLDSTEESLFNFNINILVWICKVLNTNTSIGFTDSYFGVYQQEIDYRNKFLPKNYNANPAWKPKYAQVFEEKISFQPNVSVLDILFCEGPNAAQLLRNSLD